MSRLRVLSPEGVWVDICQSEYYVRNAANTAWRRILPSNGLKVLHGSKQYWLEIDCLKEEDADNCLDVDQYGGTTDGAGENGSGTTNPNDGGTTSTGLDENGNWIPVDEDGNPLNIGDNDGADDGGINVGDNDDPDDSGLGNVWTGDYDPSTGSYSSGYGYSSSGSSGGGTGSGAGGVVGGTGSGGGSISGSSSGSGGRGGGVPNGSTLFKGRECSAGADPGTVFCPGACPGSTSGIGSGVYEFYVDLGQVSGTVDFMFVSAQGLNSLEVFYDGKRVAASPGQIAASENYRFEYIYNGSDSNVFVRVISDYSAAHAGEAMWVIYMDCPGEGQGFYGSPLDPQPCSGTFVAEHTNGTNVQEYFHDMGEDDGPYEVYLYAGTPTLFEVLQDAEVIYDTGGYTTGVLHYDLQYTNKGSGQIRVRVTSENGDHDWYYKLSCPNSLGTELNPYDCGGDEVVRSGGAGITDAYVRMTGSGKVGIRYQMWNIPDKMDVYQGDTLLASTGLVSGEDYLFFDFDETKGDVIQIRVTGEGKTSWSFLHNCPGDLSPAYHILANGVLEVDTGETSDLVMPVKTVFAAQQPVSMKWRTVDDTSTAIAYSGVKGVIDDYGTEVRAAYMEKDDGTRVVMDARYGIYTHHYWTDAQEAPSGQIVFDSWWRTSDNELFTSGASATGNATSWTLNANNEIETTANTNTLCTFISPDAYDSYDITYNIGSDNADNDMVGMVLGYANDNGTGHIILATRGRGGQVGEGGFSSANFAISYLNLATRSFTHIFEHNFNETPGGWSGSSAKLRIMFENNVFKVHAWPLDVLDSDTGYVEGTLDLNTMYQTNPEADFFRNKPVRWGFAVQSQNQSFFTNGFLSGVGIQPQHTFIKNMMLWAAKNKLNGRALVIDDRTSDSSPWGFYDNTQYYNANGSSLGRNGDSSISAIIENIMGYSADYVCLKEYSDVGTGATGTPLTYAQIKDYDLIVIAWLQMNMYTYSGGWLPAVREYIKNKGGGAVVYIAGETTTLGYHDYVARNLIDANAIAANYGGGSDASVESAEHPHQAWDTLSGKIVPHEYPPYTPWSSNSSKGVQWTNLDAVDYDYKPTEGTINFAAGETEQSIVLPIRGNLKQDGNRRVDFEIYDLQPADAGIIATSTASGDIYDDESGQIVPTYDHTLAPVGSGSSTGNASAGGGSTGAQPTGAQVTLTDKIYETSVWMSYRVKRGVMHPDLTHFLHVPDNIGTSGTQYFEGMMGFSMKVTDYRIEIVNPTGGNVKFFFNDGLVGEGSSDLLVFSDTVAKGSHKLAFEFSRHIGFVIYTEVQGSIMYRSRKPNWFGKLGGKP